MNFEYFIAKKVAAANSQSFSRLIIRVAIAAIALCLTVMICATAMISGFKKEISDKIFGFNGHIQVTGIGGASIALETPPIDKNQDFYPDLGDLEQISYLGKRKLFGRELTGALVEMKTKGGIRHIQVYALTPGIIKTKTAIEGIVLKGIGEDFDWTFMKQYLQKGQLLNLTDSIVQPYILISQQTADRLEVDTSDQFIIHFFKNNEPIRRRLKVTGIYKTGLGEFDKSFALIDIRFIQQLMGWEANQVGGFEIFLEDIDDLEVFTEYIYYEEIPSDLTGEDIKHLLPNLFGWLEFQDINEVVILSLMIVVAIINMVTALMILIIERTGMIGILKAVGSTDWSIRKIFLYHAAWIIGLGLLLGNLVGLALCFLEDRFHFITLSEENYYLSYAPIDLNLWTILLLNIGTLLITVSFLIIPTYLVTKIDPVKAIRFN